jgi:hypothetical protein
MYILGHQGWTDFFSQFGLYIHMYRHYGSATVLVIDPQQLPFVKRLFLTSGVNVELAETTEVGVGTCVLCHQLGNEHTCPRYGGRCKYPVHSYRGLCAFDNFPKWEAFRQATSVSFVEAFYLYHGVPITALYENFVVARIPESELKFQITTPYYVYHTQSSFPLRLPKGYAVPLDKSSVDFFGSLSLIEGATEIHLLQSSYCMFIYLLQLKYGLFSNKPVYVHTYARSNSNTDYKHLNRHPHLPNWTFL